MALTPAMPRIREDQGPIVVNTENEPVYGAKGLSSTRNVQGQIFNATIRKLKNAGYSVDALTVDSLTWRIEGDWIIGYITQSQLKEIA